MNYPITLSPQQQTIAIMRVENGWLVRTDNGLSSAGMETPLCVAETLETLIEIVRDWGVSALNEKARGF